MEIFCSASGDSNRSYSKTPSGTGLKVINLSEAQQTRKAFVLLTFLKPKRTYVTRITSGQKGLCDAQLRRFSPSWQELLGTGIWKYSHCSRDIDEEK